MKKIDEDFNKFNAFTHKLNELYWEYHNLKTLLDDWEENLKRPGIHEQLDINIRFIPTDPDAAQDLREILERRRGKLRERMKGYID